MRLIYLFENASSKSEFRSENPHANAANSTSEDIKRFDELPDNARVWVFHATSRKNANILLGKSNNSIELQGSGIRGTDPRLYVGSSPTAVSGYGPVILALQVRKGDIKVPSGEGSITKNMTPGKAVTNASVGAVVDKWDKIVEIYEGPPGRYAEEAFDALTRTNNI